MVSYERPALGEPFRADGRSGPAQTPTPTPYDFGHLDEVYLKIDSRMVYL